VAERLLIVDDEPGFRALATAVGKNLGYEVASVGCASAFRRAFAEAAPNLIVLDIVMPETDGIELIRWLGEAGYRGRVLVVTGYDAAYADVAVTMGELRGMIATVLLKPVSASRLQQAMAHVA